MPTPVWHLGLQLKTLLGSVMITSRCGTSRVRLCIHRTLQSTLSAYLLDGLCDAINCSLMTFRKRRARPEVSIISTSKSGDKDGIPIEFKDLLANPEQMYAQRQHYFTVLRTISKLEPNLRAVVEVRVLRECTVSEAAQLLDITEAAAKSRTLRARARLNSKRTPGSSCLRGEL